jgi:hypothetical protein
MLGSITPLGERGHARRWSATVTLYVLGSVAGGAVLGIALGALGRLLHGGLDVLGVAPSGAIVLMVLAVVCVVGVLLDLQVGGRRLPTWHRQVNEDWLVRYRGWVVGLGFGFQLGLAVATIVTSATVYVALSAALLSGSVVAGLVIGVVFGLARALPILAARRVHDANRLRAQHQRLARWRPRAHATAVAAQVVVAVLALTAVVVLPLVNVRGVS